MIHLLDTYTDILIGAETEQLSLHELILRCSRAWTTKFNERRVFLALRCDLVRKLID